MAAQKLESLSTETFLLHLLSRLDAARHRATYASTSSRRKPHHQPARRTTMTTEIRTLDFWRAVIGECLASFLYVFLLCATHLTWTGSMFIFGPAPNWLVIALTSGFAMATLIQCFGHISGGHVNPSLTLAFMITKRISPVRALFYLLAHCSGAIAGAALLYGVTVTGSQSMGPLGITSGHDSLNCWQILSVEFVLTFVVVFTTYATLDSNRKSFGSDSLAIGLAYLVTSLTGLPASGASMNPARSLGPAFVMNRWQYHWVYWVGPILGGIVAGCIYEFIFETRKFGKYVHDVFDDMERDSNVEDDYEDPDLNKQMTQTQKMMYSSASAASSGSSSGHRSNHTQHSIVSVHGPPPIPHYDAYRPMISSFGASSTIQEISPTIYNEPTGPTGYYQANGNNNNGSNNNNSSSGSSNNGNSNTGSNATANGNTFYCGPPTSTNGRFGHNTMRSSLPHHQRMNYDGTVVATGTVPVNPKF